MVTDHLRGCNRLSCAPDSRGMRESGADLEEFVETARAPG